MCLNWPDSRPVPALHPLGNGRMSARSPPEDKEEQRGGSAWWRAHLIFSNELTNCLSVPPLCPQSAPALRRATRRLITNPVALLIPATDGLAFHCPEGTDSSQGTEITQCTRAASAGSSASSATKMQNRSSPLTDEAKVFSLQAIYSNLIFVFNTSLMFWVLRRESLWIISYICIIKGQPFFPGNSRSSSRVAFSLVCENGKDKFAS